MVDFSYSPVPPVSSNMAGGDIPGHVCQKAFLGETFFSGND